MSDSTDLSGYDIVLCVTQDAINNALMYSSVWSQTIDYNLTANPPPPNVAPNPLPPQSQCMGLFNASLAAPTLSLTLPSGAKNTNQVAVTLTFLGGQLQTFNPYSYQWTPTDVTGWTIQFNVDLALAAVTQTDASLPTDVQEALSNANLSITKLFFDLFEIDWTDAVFTSPAGKVTDTTLTGPLEQALTGWFKTQEAADVAGVLSYLQTAGSGYTPPTAIAAFVPTAYSFSVTPWNPALAQAPYNVNTPEMQNLGTINFLMMTQGRPLPTDPSAGIFNTNWVSAPNTESYQGTMCIRNALFTEGFVKGCLLPSIATTMGATNVTTFGSTPPTYTQNNNNLWTVNQETTLYGNENDGKGKQIKQTWSHSISVYEKIFEQVTFTVALDPTTCQYAVNGAFNGNLTMTETVIGFIPIAYSSLFQQQWSFTVDMKAGADGAISAEASDITLSSTTPLLACHHTAIDNGYDHCTTGDDFFGSLAAGFSALLSNITTTYATLFQQKCQDLTQQSLKDIGEALAPAMTALSANVIFPGGRDYSYKTLSFSTGGEENLMSFVTVLN